MEKYADIKVIYYLVLVFFLAFACVLAGIQPAHAQEDYPSVPDSGIDNKIYTFAQLNEGEYGNSSAVDQHPNGYGVNIKLNAVVNSPSASFTDASCNEIYKLSYEIYDVDYDGEVRVYINNVYAAFIRATGEGLSARRKIEFCGSLLRENNNLIEFRVDDSSRVWSVKDILLKYRIINSVDFTADTNSTAAYGNGFGSNKHPNYIVINFNETQGNSRQLSVTGWDIDQANEVSVYFNDHFIGRLTPGCNNCLGDTDIFDLDKALMLSGRNQLVFVQRNVNELWGITNLFIRPKSDITPVVNLLLL